MGGEADNTLNLSHVIDTSLQQLAKLGFLAFILAWSFTLTSRSMFLNIPAAVCLIVVALWLSTQFSIEAASHKKKKEKGLSLDHDEKRRTASAFSSAVPDEHGVSQKYGKSWRDQVSSKVVEGAWETLCGSILQEFVYDMWYSSLTPDREFPREIRRVLNTAFGELACRARKIDLKGMLLRDVSELVIDQIELYRDTRESIIRGLDPEAWSNMPLPARDRALLAELKAERNLHPALYPPDAASPTPLGHYKVIQTISEGIVAFLMERSDHAKTMMRSVARELLATCVLRTLIGQITPYNINKLVLYSLQKRVERKPLDLEEVAAAAEAKIIQPDNAKGNWEFTQRAKQSIQQEESLAFSKSAKQIAKKHVKHQQRTPEPVASREASGKEHGLMKRVKSDNSLQPRHSLSRSDSWDELHNPPPHSAGKPPVEGARRQVPPLLDPASRTSEAVSTSGRPPGAGHARSSSTASDAGNVMGMTAANAQWRSKGGFIGRPRARVVAAELNSEGSKDVVMYKIRVADSTGEWTVSRRFRNFEALHRALKEVPTFRLKMPAKRVFTHSQTVEFVEERRHQLDAYLQQLLGDPVLSSQQDTWEFLSAWSEMYGLDCDQSLLGTINASLRDVNVNVRRAVGDIVDDLDSKRKKANASLSKLSTNLTNSRVADSSAAIATDTDGLKTSQRQHSILQLPRLDSSDSLQGSKTRLRSRGQSLSTSGQKVPGTTDFQNLAATLLSKMKVTSPGNDARWESPQGSEASARVRKEEFRGEVLHYSYVGSNKTSPARNSPSSSIAGEAAQPSERRAAEAPRGQPSAPLERAMQEHVKPSSCDAEARIGSSTGSLRDSATLHSCQPGGEDRLGKPEDAAEPSGDSGHIKLAGAQAASLSPQSATANMEAVPPAIIPSSLAKAVHEREDLSGAALEEAAGISAPLYDVVDVLFELQSRGVFRRQVYVMARQMLSLVAGGAIDEYILSQLRALRQEHKLALHIHALQNMLWPGGTWFQRLPERQPQPSSEPQPRYMMTAENYLVGGGPAPLDDEEIREAVRELLQSSTPPALVRVIGRTAYQAGISDLFDMMQSPTFVQHLGYGLLKIVLLNIFPELRPLFRSVERGPSPP